MEKLSRVLNFIFCYYVLNSIINYTVSATELYGVIDSHNNHWGKGGNVLSPIIVTGDILVPHGIKLKIEPGTTIIFTPHIDNAKLGSDDNIIEVIIEGEINASGTFNNYILFTSGSQYKHDRLTKDNDNTTDIGGDWISIKLRDSSTSAIFNYCIIEYAEDGINIESTGDIRISNSILRYNKFEGIDIVLGTPKIFNNKITNNVIGINIYTETAILFRNNTITNNEYGIIITGDASRPNLGMHSDKGMNKIYDNQKWDIYSYSKEVISAIGNYWKAVSPREIDAKIYDDEEDRGDKDDSGLESGSVVFDMYLTNN